MSKALRAACVVALLVVVSIASYTAPAHAAAPKTAPVVGSSFATRAAITTIGVPRFEVAPCTFNFPQTQVEGKTVTCGIAVLPESHATPNNGRTVRLPVAVVKAISATPAPEPTFILAGGPGQPGQVFASAMRGVFYQGLAANNDVIFHDQRGTGASQPNLHCTELGDIRPERYADRIQALANAPTEADLLNQCRDRLTGEGVNLAAFTTTENAADVNDIRAILGYGKMNVYGASYGTELALAVERDYPQTLRSVVLESIVPHQIAFFFKEPQTFDRAIKELSRACAADDSCTALNPDVLGTFQKAVAQLNTAPVSIIIPDLTTGRFVTLKVDGAGFSSLLFQLLYSTTTIPYLPSFILQVEKGDYGFLKLLATQLTESSGGIALGQHFSMECGHDTSQARLAAEIAADQNVIPEARIFEATSAEYYTVCQNWPTKGADPKADAPVSSSVPTLLVNNQFDPITPPDYGTLAQQTLSNSYYVLIPGGGHSASGSVLANSPAGTCSFSIWTSWIANPTAAPNTTCTQQIKVSYKAIPSLRTSPTPGSPTASPTATATAAPATTTPPLPGLPNTGNGRATGPGVAPDDALPLFGLALAAVAAALTASALIYRRRRTG